MAITNQMVDQAYTDLHAKCGGLREDYFALVYLERERGIAREQAIRQVAFGGNDYGFDAFHIDAQRRILYLFQFKWSLNPDQFRGSFKRLISTGMDRVFGNSGQSTTQNQVLAQLANQLLDDRALIDTVVIEFVFNGDPAEASRSATLDKLREDLEDKRYLLDQFFGRPMSLRFKFTTARENGGVVDPPKESTKSHPYTLLLDETLVREGPNGESMTVGFVRIVDLVAMYREMGIRFFERNIRAGLNEAKPVNRAIQRAFKSIVLDGTADPRAFAFDHNGVTIAAALAEPIDGGLRVIEPRLLNGAQTVTTYSRFLKLNEGNARLAERQSVANEIRLLCKVITRAEPAFVTTVTINNNRQNPVEPWNLRANDEIQLALQDKLRHDLGIFCERQQNAFEAMTTDGLRAAGITQFKPVELLRLAQTFLASDGDIDKFGRMREVFENEKVYDAVFNAARLNADSRKIVLCYKVQFKLKRVVDEILEKGEKKYDFVKRARNLLWALLCQAMLNDVKIETYADAFGTSLVVEANFTGWLGQLAANRRRLIIKDAIASGQYAVAIREEKYDFLRTNAMYKECMRIAYDRYGWTELKLSR